MYSVEERKKAVELYYKYGKRIAAVLRDLDYKISKQALKSWVREYEATGTLHEKIERKKHKYSNEQKKAAVAFYLEHGRSIKFTLESMGYPGRTQLKQWIDELAPNTRQVFKGNSSQNRYPEVDRIQAITDLVYRDGSAKETARKYGVKPCTIYFWKKNLADDIPFNMKDNKTSKVSDKERIESIEEAKAIIAEYEKNIARLKEENKKLEERRRLAEIQVAVLEKAEEILKKEKGISLENLKNRDKAKVIDALRKRFSLNELIKALNISKSSYCYNAKVLRKDKYAEARACVKRLFEENNCCYGYRRIHCLLRRSGTVISEKVVRRLMGEEKLKALSAMKRKYSSYRGEITPAVPNLLERDFHADRPNEKWLTDITEFSLTGSKVYLSPLIDCYDGLVVSWSIGTSPNSELVTTMLDKGISSLREGESSIIHSDRGCHYRWPQWIDRMDNAGLVRSMSKKGCSPDNSACEGFFGRLKNEMFYNRNWIGVSADDFMHMLDNYIHWYNEKRIKMSLGGLSPLEFRMKNKENIFVS